VLVMEKVSVLGDQKNIYFIERLNTSPKQKFIKAIEEFGL